MLMDMKACLFGQDQVAKLPEGRTVTKSLFYLYLFFFLFACSPTKTETANFHFSDLNRLDDGGLKLYFERPSAGLAQYLDFFPSMKNKLIWYSDKTTLIDQVPIFYGYLTQLDSLWQLSYHLCTELGYPPRPTQIIFIQTTPEYGALAIKGKVIIPIHLLFEKESLIPKENSKILQLFLHELAHAGIDHLSSLQKRENLARKVRREGFAEYISFQIIGESMYNLQNEQLVSFQENRSRLEQIVQENDREALYSLFDMHQADSMLYFLGLQWFLEENQDNKFPSGLYTSPPK